jgi:hypothetical protein
MATVTAAVRGVKNSANDQNFSTIQVHIWRRGDVMNRAAKNAKAEPTASDPVGRNGITKNDGR